MKVIDLSPSIQLNLLLNAVVNRKILWFDLKEEELMQICINLGVCFTYMVHKNWRQFLCVYFELWGHKANMFLMT